ncbi:40812_t:CDS:2, partial [Gigaspora margarita]
VYPLIPNFTQKSRNNTPQYSIPNSYIVETEVSDVSSTKLSIAVVNTFLQINQKPSTKLSGPRLFGFDIEPLYYVRLQIGS